MDERTAAGQPAARTQGEGSGRSETTPVRADLPAVLARQVAALADATGASCIVAWGRGPTGSVEVLAARIEGPALLPPSEAAWQAFAALPGPTDLTEPDDPTLAKLAAEHGIRAAAPLRGEETEPIAVLLVGAANGTAQPRLLAALAAAVARSLRPAVAAAALERLGRLDTEVQRIDRLAAVGSLLAEIVHEIRNPLVSIKTFLHLESERSELGTGDGERAEPNDLDPTEFRDVAIDELRRVERLLEAVSQHARPPRAANAEAIGEVDAALHSVTQLAALRAVARGVTVEVESPESIAPAAIAGDALRQILLNLALNAIEATPRGGGVRIAARECADGIEIVVEDEGPGIPNELLTHLFEPFVSTKLQPSGLGLAITRRLVEDVGGAITASSRETGGARFCVTLPLARV
jgi:two-component system sensor histidine kinase HydH